MGVPPFKRFKTMSRELAHSLELDYLISEYPPKPFVLGFYARRTDSCQGILESLNGLLRKPEYHRITLIMIDTGEFPDLAERFFVEEVPQYVFIHDGRIQERISAPTFETLKHQIDQVRNKNGM